MNTTPPTYERIVLAVDANSDGGPALPIAAALGTAVGTWEVLTVARDERDRRLHLEHLADRDDRLSPTYTMLRTNHVAAGIAHHVIFRPNALLVIGSTGRHLLMRPSDRHSARNVLAHTDHPTLVVGPHADPLFEPYPGTLVVCINTSDPHRTTIDAVDRWWRTFSPVSAWIVEVVATTDDPTARGDRDVRPWAAALEDLQVPATTRVLHGGDPVEWLDEFASRLPNPAYVTTSRRYSDAHRHLHSVTADLVRRSHHPVLVVPDHHQRWQTDERAN